MLQPETIYFAFFVLLRKARFKVHNFKMRQILRKKHNLTYTTCQTFNQTLELVSEVEKKLHSKGHFMKYVTRRKRILLQLPCFSDKHEFKIIKLWIALELCVGFPKKSLHSRNHALDYVSPSNDLFCLFRVSFKSLSLN